MRGREMMRGCEKRGGIKKDREKMIWGGRGGGGGGVGGNIWEKNYERGRFPLKEI